MKQEPELIDIFAMFAMHAQVNNPLKPQDSEARRLIAERSYAMAMEMMAERKKRMDNKND
jgi:hypothetical protein